MWNWLIVLAYCSLFSFGLLDNLRGPFLPEIINDLSLSGTTSSIFFACTSLAAFFGSTLSPLVLRRWSSVKLLVISSIGLGFAFAFMATAQTYFLLLLSAGAVGLAFGALNLAQNVLIGEAASPQMRRRIYSGLHSMYGLSALTAPIAATGFRWLGADWRITFFVLSSLPIIIATIAIYQKHKQKHKKNLRQNPSGVSSELAAQKLEINLNAREWMAALFISFVMAGYLFGEISASTRMVLWLRSERGFSPDMANLYLAGFFVLLLGGRLLFSFYHFSLGNESVLRISAVLSAVLYGLGLVSSPIWMVVSGLTMAPFFPVAMDFVSERFGRKSSSALSLVLGLGSLSVVGMHTFLGVLTDWKNLNYALWMGPIGLGLIVVVFWPSVFFSQPVTKK